jgi:predicted enzyme related to lactoylglutathione lyase
MNYRLVETGGQGGINGGILKPEREGRWPGNMTLYIDVDDLAAYRERIVALDLHVRRAKDWTHRARSLQREAESI